MSFFQGLLLFEMLFFLMFEKDHSQNPGHEPAPAFSTYSGRSKLDKPVEAEINALLAGFEKPQLEEKLLGEEWHFAPGDRGESIIADHIFKPKSGESVNLPHQFPEPNRVLWYSKSIDLLVPSVIRISADDGAQLFIDGVQQKRVAGELFLLTAGTEIQLSVRVINNAMSGGLKKVSISSKEDYDRFLQEKGRYEQYLLLGQKLKRFRGADKAMVEAVKLALKTEDDDLLLQAEKYFEDYPYMLSGPYLQKPAKDVLHILMETAGNCDCTLFTGKKETDLKVTEQDSNTALHDFKLVLNPVDALLYYRIQCDKTISRVYKAKLKEDKKAFSFNVWADSQGGWNTFSKFMENVRESEDVFGVGVGDLVNNGADPHAWQSFFSTLSKAGAEIPFHLIPGNHDYDGAYDDLNPTLFNRFVRNGGNNNYFAWTYANCAFIALDPNENFPVDIPEASAQYKWFLEQLATQEWLEADWRFVLVHQPPFSQGWQGYHGEESIKTLILNTAEIGKIDFVVSGHTHDYERLSRPVGNQKVHFLIVGGAGGGLEPKPSSDFPKMDTVIKAHHIGRFDVSGQHLKFTVIGQDNEVLDAFELSK